MYEMNININDVNAELMKNHKITSKGLVKKAFEYASQLHNGQMRKSGEPYIMHPLRVSYLVASWGFESDVVCAALLHDTIEDTLTTKEKLSTLFGSSIANMVDALTAMDKELKNKLNLTKEELDELSDKRLRKKMSEKALFIKIADRIDNLNTIDIFPEDKKIAKAIHTREVLIPMVMHEEAYQLIDILEDLCLKIEHPKRYHIINELYTELRNANSYTTQKSLQMFSKVFSSSSSVVAKEYLPLCQNIVAFTYNTRSSISIYRQLNAAAHNLAEDYPKLLCKKNVALYDLTLIIADDCKQYSSESTIESVPLTEVFLKLYDQCLADKGFCILDKKTTSSQDSDYYIICDEMDNLYRLFVKTETEYMRYKLGHIIDFEDIKFDNSDVNGVKKIKVFKKNQTAMYIDAGATMLDFAFAIHSEIGFHFDYALIDDSLAQHKAHEKLTEGDRITIITNPDVKPNLQWFRYVKTANAINHLIKKLSDN